MNINIVVPENCEAETITVVYKYKAIPNLPILDEYRGISDKQLQIMNSKISQHVKKPLENNGNPAEKWSCKTCGAEFDSIRSCGQHSRHCGKKASKHGRWSPEQTAYLMEHWGKGNNKEVVQHLGFSAMKCSDKYGSEIRKAKPDESIKATDESVSFENETTAPPAPPVEERWSSNIRGGTKPSFIDSVKSVFQKKEFQVPADFDAAKPFGIKSYVYHAPGREIGKIVTIDMNTKLVTVDFGSTAKKFTIEAAKAMHKEMIARAK